MRLVRACAFLLTALTIGCRSPHLLDYEPSAAIVPAPLVDTVVVVKAEEARPLAGASNYRNRALLLIPLYPYRHYQISPDSYKYYRHVSDFRKELAETVIKDLKKGGLARHFVYAEPSSHSLRSAEKGHYVIRLKLQEARWNRYDTLYGMSILTVMATPLGFPIRYGDVKLAFTATIDDGAGHEIGQKEFSADTALVQDIYAFTMNPALNRDFGRIAPALREFAAKTIARARSEGLSGEG